MFTFHQLNVDWRALKKVMGAYGEFLIQMLHRHRRFLFGWRKICLHAVFSFDWNERSIGRKYWNVLLWNDLRFLIPYFCALSSHEHPRSTRSECTWAFQHTHNIYSAEEKKKYLSVANNWILEDLTEAEEKRRENILCMKYDQIYRT